MQGKGIQWNTCYTQILSKTNIPTYIITNTTPKVLSVCKVSYSKLIPEGLSNV